MQILIFSRVNYIIENIDHLTWVFTSLEITKFSSGRNSTDVNSTWIKSPTHERRFHVININEDELAYLILSGTLLSRKRYESCSEDEVKLFKMFDLEDRIYYESLKPSYKVLW